MKKLPWGIIAGALAIVISLITAGVVAGYVVLSAIAGATNNTVTLFQTSWQTFLFITDCLLVALFVMSIVFYIIKKRATHREPKEENDA